MNGLMGEKKKLNLMNYFSFESWDCRVKKIEEQKFILNLPKCLGITKHHYLPKPLNPLNLTIQNMGHEETV